MLGLAVASFAAQPVAPDQWTADTKLTITLQNQPVKAVTATEYVDATNQQTRTDVKQLIGMKTIVTQYGIKKQMAVANGRCVQYCPTTNSFFNEIKIGDGTKGTTAAKDVGAATKGGVQTEGWQWSDKLIIINMDTKTLFVDANGAPVQMDEAITPFGKPLGNASTVYSNFKAGPLAAGVFNVTGIANCPLSPKCQQEEDFPARGTWAKAFSTKFDKDDVLED